MIETGGNVNAMNTKHGAYGPLQIRAMCLADVNDYAGTKYTLRQFVGNVALSKWAFEIYATRYSARTLEDAVALWHFGPTGRTRKNSGDDYVRRVMATYERLVKEGGK
jgi:hypothetical protein